MVDAYGNDPRACARVDRVEQQHLGLDAQDVGAQDVCTESEAGSLSGFASSPGIAVVTLLPPLTQIRPIDEPEKVQQQDLAPGAQDVGAQDVCTESEAGSLSASPPGIAVVTLLPPLTQIRPIDEPEKVQQQHLAPGAQDVGAQVIGTESEAWHFDILPPGILRERASDKLVAVMAPFKTPPVQTATAEGTGGKWKFRAQPEMIDEVLERVRRAWRGAGLTDTLHMPLR